MLSLVNSTIDFTWELICNTYLWINGLHWCPILNAVPCKWTRTNTPITLNWAPRKSHVLNFQSWIQDFAFKSHGFFSSRRSTKQNNKWGITKFILKTSRYYSWMNSITRLPTSHSRCWGLAIQSVSTIRILMSGTPAILGKNPSWNNVFHKGF